MIIYNPSNSPVVYSENGHILGGDDRIEVDALDKHGKRAVDHGYLIVLEEEKAEEDQADEAPGRDAAASPASTRAKASKAKPKAEDSGASTGSETD
jgi:hypothetical protein